MPGQNKSDGHGKAATVIHMDGQAHAVRLNEGQVRLSLGTAIFSGDVLETNAGDHLTVLFSDGSELSLAPHTRLSLDSFVFNRAMKISRLDAWVLDGAFVFAGGMMSDGGAAVFQAGLSKLHLTNGRIAGKINPLEHVSMFTLLAHSDGYVGNASLLCKDNAVLLGGANDTSVVSDDTGKASKVFRLSDADLADSYKGLFIGAWQGEALDQMSQPKQSKPTTADSRLRTTTVKDSKKSA